MKPFLVLTWALLLIPAAARIQAAEDGVFEDDPYDFPYEEKQKHKWQEDAIVLPPYPDGRSLIALNVDTAGAPFDYYIDKSSVTRGEDDVIRYTVVIESTSGARNVMYEGIRCRRKLYRTYAFGTGDGQFTRATVSEWQHISGGGTMRHRRDLHRFYFCDDVRARKVSEILYRIEHDMPIRGEEPAW